MVKVQQDMTGWKMWEHGIPDSKLTVIERAEDYLCPDGTYAAMWLCECNCDKHNQIIVRGTHLRNGNTKSCGCISRNRIISFNKEIKKKSNQYSDKLTDEYGDYYIGLTINTNNEFFVDAEDYDKIKDLCWTEHITKSGYHALEARKPDSTNIIRMHYLITGKNFDHKDRNPLNNRRYNLREPGECGNAQNHSLRCDNTSGVSGVNFDNKHNYYIARIQANNNRILLGHFDNIDDAIVARLKAENKYFGEFAPQKHLFEQYGITEQDNLTGDNNEI